MGKVPENLKYTKEHEWILVLDDGNIKVGITDHAQSELNDIVFVELPEKGDAFDKGDELGVVESTKAASEIYSPLSGTIVEINETLVDFEGKVHPINADAYGDGWLVVIKPSKFEEDSADFISADEYTKFIAE